MREALFVKQNADKWRSIEENPPAAGQQMDPDELVDNFVELTDDLSYAQTFYPDATVTRYLNGLAAQMHRSLMQNRREEKGRFVAFWKYELPTLFYQSQPLLLVSALAFFIACAIGWLSAAHDDTYVRLILGDNYVNNTLENIKAGNPMGIYGDSDQATMFMEITSNNIRVAFNVFVFGLFASVGTLLNLLFNGVMVGSFQYFFYERGLLLESALKIWTHGTIEISSIIVAGCAGLTLGNSLLFPGTLSRLESFKRGVKQGLRITIGLIPMFIIAGFLESFVTRLTLPIPVSVGIIGASAAFIIWYFVIYPIQLNRRTND